jgi:hypothetical protein
MTRLDAAFVVAATPSDRVTPLGHPCSQTPTKAGGFTVIDATYNLVVGEIQAVIRRQLEDYDWGKIAEKAGVSLGEVRRRVVEEASEWWPYAVRWSD